MYLRNLCMIDAYRVHRRYRLVTDIIRVLLELLELLELRNPTTFNKVQENDFIM